MGDLLGSPRVAPLFAFFPRRDEVHAVVRDEIRALHKKDLAGRTGFIRFGLFQSGLTMELVCSK